MKNKITIIISLLALAAATGCKRQPSACFSHRSPSPTYGGKLYSGESIQFSNCSTDGHAYQWNFGDSTSSSEFAPVHTYDSAGTYIVTLKVYSKGDMKSSEHSENIIVEKTAYEKLAGKWDIHTKEIDYTYTNDNDTSKSISGWIDFTTDSTLIIFDPDSTNNDSLDWTYEGTSTSSPYGIMLKIGNNDWFAYLDDNNTELRMERYFNSLTPYWFKYHCTKN